MRLVACACYSLFVFASLGTRVTAQPPAAIPRIDSLFTNWIAPNAPGCAVGVYEGDRIAYARGYGLANVEHGVPITSQTVFRIGGLSKQFTAFAIVLLAQDGKLALDDLARKYVPEVPQFAGTPITIRHLLNHTSGLREFYPSQVGRLTGAVGGDVVSTRRILDYLSHQTSLNFPTGSRFTYSNTNFTVAGEIVRRVSRQALPVFALERIFGPLGMTHSGYMSPQAIVPRHATAYLPSGSAWMLGEPSNEVDDGPGNANSTVEDLVHWNANLVTHRIGGESARAMLIQRARTTNGDSIPYALGLQRGTFRGQDVIGHQTRFWGYQSSFLHFPAFGAGVAVLCNRPAHDSPTALARSVATAAWPTQFAPEAAPPAPSALISPAPFAGVYFDLTTRMLFQLGVSGDTVRSSFLGTMRLIGPDRYKSGSGFTFQLLPGATITEKRLIVTNSSNPYTVPDTLVRLGSQWMPTRADLLPYGGKYYSTELDATLTIAVAGDASDGWFLMATPHYGGAPFGLDPMQRDLFATLDAGGNVRFLRDAHGQFPRLEVNLRGGTIGVLFDRLPR